jgi:hypothetical protein
MNITGHWLSFGSTIYTDMIALTLDGKEFVEVLA